MADITRDAAVVSDRIRVLREEKGMKQADLAAAVGRSQRWVSDRERGAAKVTIDDLVLIAGALGEEVVLVFGPYRFAGGRSQEPHPDLHGHWEILTMGSQREIGQRLRTLRESVGLSQEKLAEKLGQTQRWLSVRERGGTKLPVDDIAAIAEAMGFHVDVVIARSDRLLELLASSSPDDLQVVEMLLRVLPGMRERSRKMLVSMIELAAEELDEEGSP